MSKVSLTVVGHASQVSLLVVHDTFTSASFGLSGQTFVSYDSPKSWIQWIQSTTASLNVAHCHAMSWLPQVVGARGLKRLE